VTDYADLIARLLRISDFVYGDDLENAVEALKAQAKRIAELEYDAKLGEDNDTILMRDIEYYRARIAELTAALNSINLCSQNSASSKEECGRIARAALEKK